MQKIISPKFIITIIVVAAFMLIIKSCKKIDTDATITEKTEQARLDVVKKIKEQYGDVSAGIIMPVNKQATEYYYKDATGKMVSLYGSTTTSIGTPGVGGINGPSVCKANCNTTSNPADLRIIYTLDYVQRFYMCESSSNPDLAKSIVSVKWTVSVPFQLGYTIGYPPPTYGTVRFKNSSGTVINTLQANGYEVTETMIGADPGCPTWNNLWEVSYSFTNVGNGNFASGNTIEASISLENDCPLVGNLITSNYVSAPTFSQNAYLPCNRIDMVYGYSGITKVIGNAAGLCTQPSGFNYTDYHQLEYRKVVSLSGSLKWEDQIDNLGIPSTVYWGVPSTPTGNTIEKPEFSPFDETTLTHITTGSGSWLIRYRNVKTGTCDIINPYPSGPPNGNWGNTVLWVTKHLSF